MAQLTGFEKGAKRFPDLEADFDETSAMWWFSTPQGKEKPRAEDQFKVVAARAAVAVGLCSSDHPEPWRVWLESMLDYIRRRGWDGLRVISQRVQWKDLPPVPKEDPTPSELALEKFLDQATAPLTDSEWAQLRALEKAALADGERKRIRAGEFNEKLAEGCPCLQHVVIERVFAASADYYTVLAALGDGAPKVAPAPEAAAVELKPATPPVVASPTVGQPHQRSKAPAVRRFEVSEQLKAIQELVRAMVSEGTTRHQEICRRLGDHPRPPRAGWRDLPWPRAYREHRGAVARWLSDASHR